MGRPSLVLYFDVVSPFAYLAFHLVRTSPVFKDCDVIYIPVFLGGIMNKTGNIPPITIKNKGKWIGKERLRWACKFNIPMADQMPPGFPANTIPAQRALTVVAKEFPQQLEETAAAIFEASFVKREEVHTLKDLQPIFEKILGEGATKEVLSKATSDEIKRTLTAMTDEALASGSFGLPWFEATNNKGETECYWGFDHLGQVADHLGLSRPQSGNADDGGWKAML